MGALKACAESGRLELLGLQSNPQRMSGVPSTPTGSTLRSAHDRTIYTIQIRTDTRNVNDWISGCPHRNFWRPGDGYVTGGFAAWGVAGLPGRGLRQRRRGDAAWIAGVVRPARREPHCELPEDVHHAQRNVEDDGAGRGREFVQRD